jgi:uncharacterized protein YcfJ
MKRIAASALVLALTAATGSAVAAYQDYGNGSSYDSRYDNGNQSYNNGDSRYNNGDPRYADSAYRANSRNDIAQVIGVRPLYGQNGAYQRQECWDERSNAYDNGYYRDGSGNLYRSGDSNTDGTLLGALIGGALGNQVGKGDGRTAATIGGAVIGGVIGNNVDRNNNSNNYNNNYDQYRGSNGSVTRCRTVTDQNNNRSISGYDVTYRYSGQTYHTVTYYRPGRTMPVRVSVMPQGNNTAYRY